MKTRRTRREKWRNLEKTEPLNATRAEKHRQWREKWQEFKK